MAYDVKDLRKALENVVQITSAISASTSLANGTPITATFAFTANSGGVLITEPDITVYMGSVSVDNAFPDGSNIDMSQWQVMGPFLDWGGANANGTSVVAKVYVRNISAGTQTVIFKGWGREIVNSVSNLGSAS